METLQSLLQETLTISKDPEMTRLLSKAKALAIGLETNTNGILSQFRLDGQVAFVTGGGQGIGRTFCHALGEAGCKIAVADLAFDRAEIVAAELKAKGIDSAAFKVDVSNKTNVESVVQEVITTFGDLHVGVNNAGVIFHSDSENTPQSQWETTMKVNLDGVFYCCQAEAKHMLTKGYGRIINTASTSAIHVSHPQKQVAYNVSKAGVVHLTKTLGTEWAHRGIRVNCISPGIIDTPLSRVEALLPLRQIWIKTIPIGRFGQVEDLKGGIVFLASPAADYVTGCNLVIDGGQTCW